MMKNALEAGTKMMEDAEEASMPWNQRSSSSCGEALIHVKEEDVPSLHSGIRLVEELSLQVRRHVHRLVVLKQKKQNIENVLNRWSTELLNVFQEIAQEVEEAKVLKLRLEEIAQEGEAQEYEEGEEVEAVENGEHEGGDYKDNKEGEEAEAVEDGAGIVKEENEEAEHSLMHGTSSISKKRKLVSPDTEVSVPPTLDSPKEEMDNNSDDEVATKDEKVWALKWYRHQEPWLRRLPGPPPGPPPMLPPPMPPPPMPPPPMQPEDATEDCEALPKHMPSRRYHRIYPRRSRSRTSRRSRSRTSRRSRSRTSRRSHRGQRRTERSAAHRAEYHSE